MFAILTAFFLYEGNADWGWWVLYGVVLSLQLLGLLKIAVNSK